MNLLLKILFDEEGGTLAITRKTANTLITAAGFNTNYGEIEAVVNGDIDATNLEDDAVTAAKLNSDVVRADYGLLMHTTGALQVDVSDTNPCLEISDGGVRIKVDDSTIERASGGIQLKDGGIAAAKIASNAVTTAKITDSNITTAKIADANVTTAKIADANITTAKILDDNVTEDKLADYAESFGTSGYVKLTGGLTIQWGTVSADGAVTFPVAFSHACYSVMLTQNHETDNNANLKATGVSTTGFTADAIGGTTFYMAIGY